jgi:hypothetical protein
MKSGRWLRARAGAGLLRAVGLSLLLWMAAGGGTARAQPYTIPLYHSDIGGKQHLVIYAGVGGGPLSPYLLDTGSPAMFSTYGSWWPGHTTMLTQQGAEQIKFSSGLVFHYNTVTTDVSLGNKQGQALAKATKVNVGLITNVGTMTPQKSFQSWAANVRAGKPALSIDGTFGNFGAALHGSDSFATVLAQIPISAGLKNGFIIQSGGRNATEGKLIIGLTQKRIARFLKRLPMAPTGTSLPNPDGNASAAPGYQKTQVTNTVVRIENGTTKYWANIPTVFDTGGGDTTWIYHAHVPPALIEHDKDFGPAKKDDLFALEYGRTTLLSFETGDKPAVNQLAFSAESSDLRVNPGILMFYTYDVMFDLTDGFIGLRPAGSADAD